MRKLGRLLREALWLVVLGCLSFLVVAVVSSWLLYELLGIGR